MCGETERLQLLGLFGIFSPNVVVVVVFVVVSVVVVVVVVVVVYHSRRLLALSPVFRIGVRTARRPGLCSSV